MKAKHLKHRIKSCFLLADLSPCARRHIGCVVVDPESNVILSEGYNGNLRGCATLCGGDSCAREFIDSGEKLEVGCVHAEQNAIYNAARLGVSLVGSLFIVNAEPCPVCAKAIVQVGARAVLCISGVYSTSKGIGILQAGGVSVGQVLSRNPTQEEVEAAAKSLGLRLAAPRH